jgi:hypothetical protein
MWCEYLPIGPCFGIGSITEEAANDEKAVTDGVLGQFGLQALPNRDGNGRWQDEVVIDAA